MCEQDCPRCHDDCDYACKRIAELSKLLERAKAYCSGMGNIELYDEIDKALNKEGSG